VRVSTGRALSFLSPSLSPFSPFSHVEPKEKKKRGNNPVDWSFFFYRYVGAILGTRSQPKKKKRSKEGRIEEKHMLLLFVTYTRKRGYCKRKTWGSDDRRDLGCWLQVSDFELTPPFSLPFLPFLSFLPLPSYLCATYCSGAISASAGRN
jgi:hypothetical protein